MSRNFKNEIFDCFPRNERGIAIPINLDFDGTVIYHGYDINGENFKMNENCCEVLQRWVNDYNCQINLYTTRHGEKEWEAIKFCRDNNVPIHTINNTSVWQSKWSNSSKQYGFVIDDMSSAKIFYDENGRATVDWKWLEENFEPRLKHMKFLIDELHKEIS